MKKIFFLYLYIILLFIINIFNFKLELLLIFFCITYILYIIFSLLKFKKIKHLFLSSDFIFESVFFVYSIMAALMFIIDDYKPRVDFFRIDYDTIYRTLKLYLNINIIYIILDLLLNGPASKDFNKSISNYCSNVNYKIEIWDIVALFCSIYFLYLNFRNGFSILFTNNRILRTLIYSGINVYIYLYMITYCSIRYTEFMYIKKITKKYFLIFIITIPFWLISLLTDRRNIINLLIILTMVLFSKLKRIKVKLLLKILFVILIFLSLGYFRANDSFSKDRYRELFYMSNGEFILSHYVSEYYINHKSTLYYGKTYFVDTFTKFFPRFIYKNKPIDLSEKFYKDAKTNVGFAFNPVAEGLINFGEFGSILFVPLTIYFYVFLANILQKKNFFNFLIVSGYSINIFRGFFANSIFAIVFMCVVVFLMTGRKVDTI